MAVRIGLLLSAVVLLVGAEWSVWGWYVEWGDPESFPLTAAVFAVVALAVIWLGVLIANVIGKAVGLIADARRY